MEQSIRHSTGRRSSTLRFALPVLLVFALSSPRAQDAPGTRSEREGARAPLLRAIGFERGICAVLGLPDPGGADAVVNLAEESELLVYFQDPAASATATVRRAAEAKGLLGRRIFVGDGDLESIGLAADMAGAVVVSPAVTVSRDEILRVLHPGGRSIGLDEPIVKSAPPGIDSWTHPFHAPDNNPQSTDEVARAPYLTQFLAEPKFCPMPEVSVAAGGRVFRAFGHIAHKANQNAMLNTLICVNAYNGTILWTRKLSEGFMIHRNTLVATPDTLYLGDHLSLKAIDAETGEVEHEFVVPEGAADGPVWKWMALEGDVLYALVGGKEVGISTVLSDVPGLGHWPWGMWEGHDYKDPKTNFGSGRNFIALDLSKRKILWNHREEDYVDSRGVCMKDGRIYFYSPGKHLACLDVHDAQIRWRTDDPALLEAIGENGRAQHYVTGYATTTYIKCTSDEILFAGPQRDRLVVASTADGRLLWQKPGGNLQLVLRDDGIYAAGPSTSGVRLDYRTGDVLANLPARRACTRATGSIDSVFYRTTGGTVRLDTARGSLQHIAPMRPPCQDGVLISEGRLYWGPWMCGCQLSLYGHIALGPAGDFDFDGPDPATRLERESATSETPTITITPKDWPAYRRDSGRGAATEVDLPAAVEKLWEIRLDGETMPTAPVAASGLVLFGDRAGVVWCLGADGSPRWKDYTGASIYFPPALALGRAFVGSADGWVYSFDLASGRRLWRFRVAPEESRIPVYGNLISRWPVAGGVVVEDGTVYAAAGIAHYDGTHVVALDAETGAVKWYNSDSGHLSEAVASGVSLQGELSIEDGELRFAGGGRHNIARFDLRTGRCLNEPSDSVNSQFQTAFSPYYPDYAEFLSCRRDFSDGRTLVYDASYEGSRHLPLVLLAPQPASADAKDAPQRRNANAERRRRESLWIANDERYNSIVTARSTILVAGKRAERAFLAAVELESGERRWEVGLSSAAVRGGTAVDRDGRVIASLQAGRVVCYGER